MKKILLRLLAYVLDFCFVSFVIITLGSVNIINPNNASINMKYEDYYNSNIKYNNLISKLEEYFKDGKISETEYKEIVWTYPDYFHAFDRFEIDKDIKNSEVEELKDELAKLNLEVNNHYAYKIAKLNIDSTIITIICYILYFGILQYILKGQTLFKKLFRLRVVDNTKPKSKIPLWKYIVRSILVSEIVLTLIDVICLATLKENAYISFNSSFLQIKYLYEMAFLVTFIIRDDSRSVHDLLLNTKVVRFDKNNNIIEEKLFNDREENEKNVNKNSKTLSKNANK